MNNYKDKSSFYNIHRDYALKAVRKLLEFKENKSSLDTSVFTKEDLNLCRPEYKDIIIYLSSITRQTVNKIITDFMSNLFINAYYNDEYKKEIYYKLFESDYVIKVVDGMTLVEDRLNNTGLKEYLDDIDCLFIVSRYNELSYKNYHLTINDVFRHRSLDNSKRTIILFVGTESNARDLDYMFPDPSEINLSNSKNTVRTYNKKKDKVKQNSDNYVDISVLQNDALFSGGK